MSIEYEFDEYSYLHNNPDVLKAVDEGRFASGLIHYQRYGHKELRKVHAFDGDAPRTFVAGAFGTRNVGDEAIFEGVSRVYPNAIQLYINAPRNVPAAELYSMLRGDNKFREEDTLIIGGGGLLYDAGAIRILSQLCARAKSAKCNVRIEGLGCEAARPEYHAEIRELFSYSDYISVRSSTSQNILGEIGNYKVEKREDFALELSSFASSKQYQLNSVPVIGVVTGGDIREDIDPLIQLIKRYSSDRVSTPVRFVHIPHSMSYVGFYNNDEMVGAKIEASVNIFLEGRVHGFRRVPFSYEPMDVFQTYGTLDGIISRRYHGLVFAHMFNLPAISLPGDGLKNVSFIEDHPRDNVQSIGRIDDVSEAFRKLISNFYG